MIGLTTCVRLFSKVWRSQAGLAYWDSCRFNFPAFQSVRFVLDIDRNLSRLNGCEQKLFVKICLWVAWGKYAEFIGKDTTWDTLFAARESLGWNSNWIYAKFGEFCLFATFHDTLHPQLMVICLTIFVMQSWGKILRCFKIRSDPCWKKCWHLGKFARP